MRITTVKAAVKQTRERCLECHQVIEPGLRRASSVAHHVPHIQVVRNDEQPQVVHHLRSGGPG